MKKNKKVSQLNDAPLTQPQNRTERFLAKIAKLADTAPADTRNRLERYLAAIVQSTASAGTISADTETTVEGILFGNSTTGKVEGIVPEMSAQQVAEYLEMIEVAAAAGGVVNSSQLNKWQSNPNLMDNWYFVGGGSQQGGGQFPINQRGQTSYTGAGYGIDRWKADGENCVVTIEDDSIMIINGIVSQYFENWRDLSGKTVTLSALIKVSSGSPASIAINDSNGWHVGNPVASSSSYEISQVTFMLSGYFRVVLGTLDGAHKIKAIKLELGDKQTVAHQENGVWVLNEVPNYQEQLARCQRYYLPRLYCTATNSGSNVWWNIDAMFPVEMRIAPSIDPTADFNYYGVPTISAAVDVFGSVSKSCIQAIQCSVLDKSKVYGAIFKNISADL